MSTRPSLFVDRTRGLADETALLVGAPGVNGCEPIRLAEVVDPSTGEIRLSRPLRHSHAAGDPVVAGSLRIGSLQSAAASGDTILSLTDVAGVVIGQRIRIGPSPGSGLAASEIVTVTGPPDPVTRDVPVSPLVGSHNAGEQVVVPNDHHRNDFGGTSSATPLSAGIAALVLSAQPELIWVEAREILRTTAVKFDTFNNDPVGRWLDADGNPAVTSGKPPV
jgi:subtilisin family serine protease